MERKTTTTTIHPQKTRLRTIQPGRLAAAAPSPQASLPLVVLSRGSSSNSLPCVCIFVFLVCFGIFLYPHTPLPGKPPRHLLDAPVTTFCRRRGFGEGRQDAARDPALGRGRVVAGRLVHQAHVLLVDGEDLDHLTLAHTDFILLQCIVIFDHGHGRGPIAASQVALLGDRATGTRMQEGWARGLLCIPCG